MPTRYLKPGICDSGAIDKCSPLAETLFYRLLVNVDDFGRLDARPAVVRSKCFPLKDISNSDVSELLNELRSNSLVFLYSTGGQPYLQMNKWDNIPRSKESKCPPPPDECIQVHTTVCDPRTVLPVTVTVTETKTVNRKPRDEYPAEFEKVWNEYPGRPGMSKKATFKAWNARIKAGASTDQILEGVIRYKRYCEETNTEQQFIKQPETFLGPNEHYLNEWKPPPPSVKITNAMPWWSTDQTILAKGKELGLNPRPGEVMNEFKGRINQRLATQAA